MLWWMTRGRRPSSSPVKEILGMPDDFKTFAYRINNIAGKRSLACRAVPDWRGMWRSELDIGWGKGKAIPTLYIFQVSQEDVYEISGVIPERYIEGLLEVCQLNSYERLQVFCWEVIDALFYCFSPQEHVDIMMCEGFSGHQLISQLHDHTVCSKTNISSAALSRWRMLAWTTSRSLLLLSALLLLSTVCSRGLTSTSR